MTNLLIVDDEKAARFGMKKALSWKDYHILEAENGLQALQIIQQKNIDIVFLDLNMPGLQGMEVLSELKKLAAPPLVIVVTAYGSEKIAVEAMKKGAYDYIAKPYDLEELRLITDHALEKILLLKENKILQEKIKRQEGCGQLIGQSEVMLKIYDIISKVAKTDITVLIYGESGTGKELVAQEIHRQSKRANKIFIPVNCAAFPENLIESELFGHEKGAFTGAGEQRKGKMEEADGGILFLDEIGDMSLNTQAKILRALQEKSFERLGSNNSIQSDVRFIAATNKDLLQEIEEGKFREDLYYRIKVIDIYLPPLRQRGNDISLLINHFVEIFSKKYNKEIQCIDIEAMQKMVYYHWPGNVRQLKNTLEKSVLLACGKQLTLQDLPPEILQFQLRKEKELIPVLGDSFSFKEAKRIYVQEFEKQFITQRLKQYKGNISQTAHALDMPRQSLQQKLKELGINARESVETIEQKS
ncbi:MAG: sigma-54-dependent Fis family transcriptional regulator [Candidatus Brocadiae bacterium]|nr:sigma-54-dependent Fis family transcriptional regulator [Candidatus Brocadiia bacterium]